MVSIECSAVMLKQTSNPVLFTIFHQLLRISNGALATKPAWEVETLLLIGYNVFFKQNGPIVSNMLSTCERNDSACHQDNGTREASSKSMINLNEDELFSHIEDYGHNLDKILSMAVNQVSSADLSEGGMDDNRTASTVQ